MLDDVVATIMTLPECGKGLALFFEHEDEDEDGRQKVIGDWQFLAFSDFALSSETPDFAPSSETREAMSGKPEATSDKAAISALFLSAYSDD